MFEFHKSGRPEFFSAYLPGYSFVSLARKTRFPCRCERKNAAQMWLTVLLKIQFHLMKFELYSTQVKLAQVGENKMRIILKMERSEKRISHRLNFILALRHFVYVLWHDKHLLLSSVRFSSVQPWIGLVAITPSPLFIVAWARIVLRLFSTLLKKHLFITQCRVSFCHNDLSFKKLCDASISLWTLSFRFQGILFVYFLHFETDSKLRHPKSLNLKSQRFSFTDE